MESILPILVPVVFVGGFIGLTIWLVILSCKRGKFMEQYAKLHGYTYSSKDIFGLNKKCSFLKFDFGIQNPWVNSILHLDEDEFFLFDVSIPHPHSGSGKIKDKVGTACYFKTKQNLAGRIEIVTKFSSMYDNTKEKVMANFLGRMMSMEKRMTSNLKEVKTGNPHFDERYTVRSDNGQLISNFLTTQLVEKLLAHDKSWGIELKYEGNKIVVFSLKCVLEKAEDIDYLIDFAKGLKQIL